MSEALEDLSPFPTHTPDTPWLVPGLEHSSHLTRVHTHPPTHTQTQTHRVHETLESSWEDYSLTFSILIKNLSLFF